MIRISHFRTLGDTIRTRRVKLDLTIQDVARACSLKPVTVRRLEESTSIPLSNENLVKISNYLKMDSEKVLDLAKRYRVAMIEFLDRHSEEVQALVYALRHYSSDEVEKIIIYTLTGKEAEAVLSGKSKRAKSQI